MIYSTENEEKSSVVERWNRTMKNIMWKYFTANNTQKYIDILPGMLEKYKNTYNRSINLTPSDARNRASYQHVHNAFYANANARTATLPKFHVGDKVPITRKKRTCENGFTPNWTGDVFTINRVKATKPPTYTIKNTLGEPVQGAFYAQELPLSAHAIFREEEEKSSFCQVERRRVQFVGIFNRPSAAMNISKQYAWRPAENNCENKPLLSQNLRGLVIGKSGCGKTTVILLQPGWLGYNRLYMFGKSLHQQEYQVLREGINAGLSKQQISNLLHSQRPLKNIAMQLMDRCELTFTMIVMISQIHQHWTLCQRICCCWTIAS